MCVCPETRTSTSSCLAMALSESRSPVGMHWCPCMTPIRMGVWVTVTDSGKLLCSAPRAHVSTAIPQASGKTHLVVVAPHDIHVGRDAPEVLIRLAVAHVARAENLLDLAGHEELLELGGEVVDAVGDVEVADDENEHHPGSRSRSWSSKAVRCAQEALVAVRTVAAAEPLGDEPPRGAVDDGHVLASGLHSHPRTLTSY